MNVEWFDVENEFENVCKEDIQSATETAYITRRASDGNYGLIANWYVCFAHDPISKETLINLMKARYLNT